MQTDDENNMADIVAELRRLNAFQKKRSIWTLTIGALIAIVFAVFQFLLFKDSSSSGASAESPVNLYQISGEIDRGNLELALLHCQSLLQKMPNNPELHTKLGWIYLLKNDTKHALAEYELAYELYPSRENASELETIKKKFPRAVAAATNLPAGTVLSYENIGQLSMDSVKWSKDFIKPQDSEIIIGHKLLNTLTNRQVITIHDVAVPQEMKP